MLPSAQQEALQRVAIVGAGPIGLEAALFAVQSGYEVAVYERGTVAQNVQDWGHVQLFSPNGLNVSEWGIDALFDQGYEDFPSGSELLTGHKFAARYLLPLSRLPELAGLIHEGCEVKAIGRAGQLKPDHVGQPARGQTPFQLLLSDKTGERTAFADWVLDCSGTYPNHNWAGAGGLPCPGETAHLTPENYQLPDVLGTDRNRFANRSTLVIGGGYSAATAIVALAKLSESAPNTRAIWITRAGQELQEIPIPPIAGDALPERARLTETANRLALSANSPIQWLPGRALQSLHRTEEGTLQVTLSSITLQSTAYSLQSNLIVDEVLALVGYRPNRQLHEELQVHECYASQGPMKLAAVLLGETSRDCLTQTSPGGEALKNPEPGFFILGAKSYGRNSRFLLKVGVEQIPQVFALMASEEGAKGRRSKGAK